jgi:hypothetical protein
MAFAACTKPQLPVANYDIIPQPKEVQLNEEKPFELGPKTIVYYESGLQREAEFLSEYVNDIMGYALNVLECQGQSDGIVLIGPCELIAFLWTFNNILRQFLTELVKVYCHLRATFLVLHFRQAVREHFPYSLDILIHHISGLHI